MIRLFELAGWLLSGIPIVLRIAGARLAGRVAFRFLGRLRRNAIENMAVVIGAPASDPRVKSLARESMMQFAEHAVDLPIFHRSSDEELRLRTVSNSADEHVAAARAHGNGVIFVTAHFGNWDLAGACVAHDIPMMVVQETFASSEANELFRRIRAGKNMRAVQLGSAARPVMRALRGNGLVGIMVDRPTLGEGVDVEFFGRRTQIPAGAAKLAIRAGAPVLVGGAIRNRDQTFTVLGFPPIFPNGANSREDEVQRISQAMMRDIESLIRRRPEQWYMFRAMWPKGSVSEGKPSRAVGMAA